ncbi:Uncharacterised protein [Candidatus Tiddalikarchaeum anstoanum]|nr:Uncharacterised protein [Candidatus Tiddalikarchaeum anstoanum]
MPEGIPIQKVVDMKGRNADNNAIIEALRSEGYSFQQIRDAIQQADLKKTITVSPGAPIPQSYPQQQIMTSPQQNTAQRPPMPQQQMQVNPVQAPQMAQQQMMQAPQPQGPSRRSVDLDEVQRVLEEIIEEKWKESEGQLIKINEWRAVVNSKIKEFETRISELNTRIDSFNTVLVKKAESFDETMRNVDTEIQALEKSLNKLVPILSDNISELRGVITDLRKDQPKAENPPMRDIRTSTLL